MHNRMNRKSALLATSASAALALATMVLPTTAMAQAFQADPEVVQGNVTFFDTPGESLITVDGMDAVIDWTPMEDVNGDALTFLPFGNTATFRNGFTSTDFAVINRILPSTNGNVVQFDGAVVSQIQAISGPPSTGGQHILFYSPTGIVVGGSATFDIGSLVLTTLAPNVGSYEQFVLGTESLLLAGVPNDQTSIIIGNGAQFNAPQVGSYLVFASPEINTFGTSHVNGSTVFAAGQEMALAHSSGLFDIMISVGSVADTPIFHAGTTGGPASTGVGDNHVIYGVAQGQIDPFTALFTGNLGFDPAVSAGIENGVVVLSANYNVSGTSVVNDFTRLAPASASEADLVVDAATITSDLIGHSSNFAQIGAFDQTTEITGDVFLYGRVTSQIEAGSSGTVEITGDVVVSANAVGVTTVNANNPSDLDASAGLALITASPGGQVLITGDASVLAVGVMGFDSGTQVAGNAAGGVAEASAIGGTVEITGTLLVDASATAPLDTLVFNSGGFSDGGLAYLLSEDDGQLTVDGNVTVLANGTAYAIRGVDDGDPVGDGGGGSLRVQAAGGGQMDLGADLTLAADGSGSYSAVPGGVAGGGFGGTTTLRVDDRLSNITISGDLMASADAEGGFAESGTGGFADGGNVSVLLTSSGGLLVNTGLTTLSSIATGGDGDNGGAAESGNLTLDLQSSVFNTAGLVITGAATGGSGDNAGSGSGGTILVELTNASTLTSTGAFTATSSGTGADAVEGDGGSGTGGTVTFTLTNSTITMPAHAFSAASLGQGGNGYNGGDASGANVAVSLSNGASMSVGSLAVSSLGQAGTGQFNGGSDGLGGTATSGSATVDVTLASGVTVGGAATLATTASGGNGDTDNGGQATPGSAILTLIDAFASVGGVLQVQANGTGGDAISANGGQVAGGLARVSLGQESALTVGLLQMGVTLQGGNSSGGLGGSALNGVAELIVEGAGTNLNLLTPDFSYVRTRATGGATTGGTGIGGAATGGQASVSIQDGGAVLLNPDTASYLGIESFATGGSTVVTGGTGGNVTGGTASLNLSGTSSELFAPAVTLASNMLGGHSIVPAVNANGGTATGGSVSVSVLSESTLDASLGATVRAQAGYGSGTGSDGNAASGDVTVLIDQAIADLAGPSSIISSSAVGSFAADRADFGGNGVAGNVFFSVQNGAELRFAGSTLQLASLGEGGVGDVQGGDGTGGNVSLLVDGSTVTGGTLAVASNGSGANNTTDTAAGDGLAGLVTLRLQGGADADIATVVFETGAGTFNTGTSTGGMAQLVVQGTGTTLDSSGIFTENEASSPATANATAGIFRIDVLTGGLLTTGTLTASSFDLNNDTPETHTSRLQTLGGTFRITDSASLTSIGNITIDTSTGGQVLGGLDAANITANMFVGSEGAITINGAGSLPGIAVDLLELTSRDLVINSGVLVVADSLNLLSLNTADQAVLGGSIAGPAYSLTQAEFDRLQASSLSFASPVTANTLFNDLEIRDLDLSGSLSPNGYSSVSLGSEGNVLVSGQITMSSTGVTDNLFIGAGNRLEILLPGGGVAMYDDNISDPGLAGTLSLNARSIFAGDTNLLPLIRDNPNSAALPAILATESGSSQDGSFLFADRVDLAAGDHILTPNTGVSGNFSGIIVGPGGLRIRREGDFGPGTMRVATFGAQDNGNGSFTVNDEFFALVDFDTAPAANYTVDAELNQCNIITGDCRIPPPPPPPPEPEIEVPLTSRDYVEPPEVVTSGDALAQVEENAAFGMEFPLRLNPPPVGDQGVVDDPVTSGGDSSTSGQPDSEEGE